MMGCLGMGIWDPSLAEMGGWGHWVTVPPPWQWVMVEVAASSPTPT